MISVCLLSEALLQHLLSYLGFSYLGRGVSLHSCSSKVQLLLLTLDEGYLLTTAPSDLERGIAPLVPPVPAQPPLLGHGVAPPGHRPWPRMLERPLFANKAMPVGQPKMAGSWWRDLTECGPLEKGMANHFSILALRTP